MILIGPSVEECFKSGFKNWCRDVQIISDCMRERIPDTRGSLCKTLLYKCSACMVVECRDLHGNGDNGNTAVTADLPR